MKTVLLACVLACVANQVFAQTTQPTGSPTNAPTGNPTSPRPTGAPTNPTAETDSPTLFPTTTEPTPSPVPPTNSPTNPFPTASPTDFPTANPTTLMPTKGPTNPTTGPPTQTTSSPTTGPPTQTTSSPTQNPTQGPTNPQPTASPTTPFPTLSTSSPTLNPTVPTVSPTLNPTLSTVSPTLNPTTSEPTTNPTFFLGSCADRDCGDQGFPEPTPAPTTTTSSPTLFPTDNPTLNPTTDSPTLSPTKHPSRSPTPEPTDQPTAEPSNRPTRQPTQQPTPWPTVPTKNPTKDPTSFPTAQPTKRPTDNPTPSQACMFDNECNDGLICFHRPGWLYGQCVGCACVDKCTAPDEPSFCEEKYAGVEIPDSWTRSWWEGLFLWINLRDRALEVGNTDGAPCDAVNGCIPGLICNVSQCYDPPSCAVEGCADPGTYCDEDTKLCYPYVFGGNTCEPDGRQCEPGYFCNIQEPAASHCVEEACIDECADDPEPPTPASFVPTPSPTFPQNFWAYIFTAGYTRYRYVDHIYYRQGGIFDESQPQNCNVDEDCGSGFPICSTNFLRCVQCSCDAPDCNFYDNTSSVPAPCCADVDECLLTETIYEVLNETANSGVPGSDLYVTLFHVNQGNNSAVKAELDDNSLSERTFFAPINAGWGAPDYTPDSAQLRYHIVEGKFLSANIPNGTTDLLSIDGDTVTVVKNGTGIFVNGNTVVTPFDLESRIGVIHAIDTALVPPS